MGMLRNSLQRTFKKYINIQAPEGIGYQSLTRTQGFSKGREKKKKDHAHSTSPPVAVVCRVALASTVRKKTNPLL
jgi:hypothetical protein